MCLKSHLTVGEIARCYDVPQWKIRTLVDSLDNIEIERAGNYRLIPRDALETILAELRNRNWLSEIVVR